MTGALSHTVDHGSGTGQWNQLNQLTKVSLPVFSGDARRYESWRAAFKVCVDDTPLPSHHKLLYLREYLSGEALKSIETLPYSPSAYEAALARLEHKYGGERRRVAMHLEDVEALKPACYGNANDFEQLAETLDVAVIKLKDSGRETELGAGTFYFKLLKKLDEKSLAQYHRWLHEQMKNGTVETLLEWISQEAEFLVVARETLEGVGNRELSSHGSTRTSRQRTFLARSNPAEKVKCAVCDGSHGVWLCSEFLRMDVNQRWRKARSSGLCFRCLSSGHYSIDCTRGQRCKREGCSEDHHSLLHGKEVRSAVAVPRPSRQSEVVGASSSDQGIVTGGRTFLASEGERVDQYTKPSTQVSLRTIPVKLSSNSRSVIVSALLDDASTQTYVSTRVASELKLDTLNEYSALIEVLNGGEASFVTKRVNFQLSAVNGDRLRSVNACTVDKVTGDMKVTDWLNERQDWEHLKDIPFPRLQKGREVDLLIGSDHADLHCALEEVSGAPGEPVARQTALGWTCIGQLK